jgi:hypothetical protein
VRDAPNRGAVEVAVVRKFVDTPRGFELGILAIALELEGLRLQDHRIAAAGL